jgi:hypothetical protein
MGSPLDLFGGLGSGLALFLVPQVALAIYVLLVWDARRTGSPAASDDQLGIKTVAAALAITGVLTLAMGLQALIHLLLTFENFMPRLKGALPDLVTGMLAVIVALFIVFPKTNAAQFPKARRFTAGAIAVGGTAAIVTSFASLLRSLLAWPSWDVVASSIASFIVAVFVFGAGLGALMKASGIATAPPARPSAPKPQSSAQVPAVAPPQPYPPQPQPGYPQQPQPGYPPQQGYPPQGGGGYPPQGG